MSKYFFDITAWQIECRANSSVPTEGVGGYNRNLVAEKEVRAFRAKNLEDAKHFTDALQHSDTCSEQVRRK